jgi:hypothetical protein
MGCQHTNRSSLQELSGLTGAVGLSVLVSAHVAWRAA